MGLARLDVVESIQDALRGVMRAYPQAVSVLTTRKAGRSYGITLGSFTSLSLEPPLVLFSISKASRNHDTFVRARAFAVNLLADDQRSVSDRFAGKTGLEDRFDGLRVYHDATDAPIIGEARAYVECKASRVLDGGDHSLVLAEVVNAKKLNDKPPLLYYTQQYTTIVPSEGVTSLPESLW